jgi:hypothetical protein
MCGKLSGDTMDKPGYSKGCNPEPGDAAWYNHPDKGWIRVVVAGKDQCIVVAVDEPEKSFVVNCADLRDTLP